MSFLRRGVHGASACDVSAVLAPFMEGITAGTRSPEIVRRGFQDLLEAGVWDAIGAQRHVRRPLAWVVPPLTATASGWSAPGRGPHLSAGRLTTPPLPDVFLDPIHLHGRLGPNRPVVLLAVVMAIGIKALVSREVLGMTKGVSEAEGTGFVISDCPVGADSGDPAHVPGMRRTEMSGARLAQPAQPRHESGPGQAGRPRRRFMPTRTSRGRTDARPGAPRFERLNAAPRGALGNPIQQTLHQRGLAAGAPALLLGGTMFKSPGAKSQRVQEPQERTNVCALCTLHTPPRSSGRRDPAVGSSHRPSRFPQVETSASLRGCCPSPPAGALSDPHSLRRRVGGLSEPRVRARGLRFPMWGTARKLGLPGPPPHRPGPPFASRMPASLPRGVPKGGSP